MVIEEDILGRKKLPIGPGSGVILAISIGFIIWAVVATTTKGDWDYLWLLWPGGILLFLSLGMIGRSQNYQKTSTTTTTIATATTTDTKLSETTEAPVKADKVAKYCSICGSAIKEGDIFCENCGEKVR